MPNASLFIDTSSNRLMAGLKSTQTVDPNTIPLYFGDTLNLNIYLLTIPPGYNPQDPSNSALQQVSTAGLNLQFYLDDGTVGGTIYASQLVFTSDPTNTYFIGSIALNTAALSTLIGSATSTLLWIKVGYTDNTGKITTVFSKQVTFTAGLPTAAIGPTPPGLTPLSAEVAKQLYFPLQPVKGQVIFLESPAGHIFELAIVDNADGTASFQASQVT